MTPPTLQAPKFWKSNWARLAMLAALTGVMLIPLGLVSMVQSERSSYSEIAASRIAADWGGPQTVLGPFIATPIEGDVKSFKVVGDKTLETTKRGVVRTAWILPQRLSADIGMTTEIRSRGIFDLPVYASTIEMSFDFDAGSLAQRLGPDERPLWNQAYLSLRFSDMRGVRGETELRLNGAAQRIEPGAAPDGESGLHVPLADAQSIRSGSLSLKLNGAHRLMIAPVARQTVVNMTSDWPHPSFEGAFSPGERDVTAKGFSANWSIPALARAIPAVTDDRHSGAISGAAFGASLFTPVSLYQQTERASKYGVLFIALTFLTVFLLESAARRPAHPAHYLLIGLAQCVFFLLLLSLAEQVGFAPAYGIAAAATIALITAFAARGLGLKRRAGVLGFALILLYGVLYLILRSADYALLAGSLLAFAAIAATMFATRDFNWSSTTAAQPSAGLG